MYTDTNFRTKKALLEAVKSGREVTVFQPGGIWPSQTDGACTIEGPHAPAPHRWYARATIRDGIIQNVK